MFLTSYAICSEHFDWLYASKVAIFTSELRQYIFHELSAASFHGCKSFYLHPAVQYGSRIKSMILERKTVKYAGLFTVFQFYCRANPHPPDQITPSPYPHPAPTHTLLPPLSFPILQSSNTIHNLHSITFDLDHRCGVCGVLRPHQAPSQEGEFCHSLTYPPLIYRISGFS